MTTMVKTNTTTKASAVRLISTAIRKGWKHTTETNRSIDGTLVTFVVLNGECADELCVTRRAAILIWFRHTDRRNATQGVSVSIESVTGAEPEFKAGLCAAQQSFDYIERANV